MYPKRSMIVTIILIMMGSLMMSCETYQKGKIYHGFTLVEKKFVKEVNADCYYFQHERTGARLMKIASEDDNKYFCISFKTLPESDAGTPHILEHCVLQGSKNFPVKSPFDELMKSSLNTFLNALTGSHMTMYPVASMNEKDYFNLMHVYLDAVLYPLIYQDPRIMKQEGWHYELATANEPVVYKGVVYNEMKGAYSAPTRELGYQAGKNLFPDNIYRFSAGGYPPAIPTLTHEDFLNFHRTYYHPSNSYILLYGNADMEKELAFIDGMYLSEFDKSEAVIDIPIQEPFSEMKLVQADYSAPEGSDTKNQTYLALSYVAGLNTDQTLGNALQILQNVLINQESAPLRLALQEAGIGRDVRASIDDLKQNVFEIRVQNANPSDRDTFYEIVRRTFEDAVKNGLDPEAVEGTLNRIEFGLREDKDAQKGLSYNFQMLNGWLFADNPFLGLEYEKPLAAIKSAIKEGYLESVIQQYFLDNRHAVLLVLEPKPGKENETNEQTREELQAFKASLSKTEIETLVKETAELIAYQKEEDDPEALATIPVLDLMDIDRKAEWFGVTESSAAGVPVIHYDTFTSDVVYMQFHYDLRILPRELIPYTALLAEVMGSLNTDHYTFGDLDKALNLHTGGFSTYLNRYLREKSDEQLIPKFIVSVKALNTKLDKSLELCGEIIHHTKYNDPERLKAVLTRHQSQVEADIKRDGIGYARTRMASYFSKSGKFDEMTDGIEYYWFISDLMRNFDDRSETIIARLEEVAGLLFGRENLLIAVTASGKDLETFRNAAEGFVTEHPSGKRDFTEWDFELSKKNEGLLTASKVQYVLQGYDFKKLGQDWSGKMRVLNQIISRDWLHNRVRVVGGAYGGGIRLNPTGMVYFYSYRDPNLKETLDTYKETAAFLNGFDADDKEMARYIIGTVSGLDRPRTPSGEGALACQYYYEGTTAEDLQKERDEVLNTTTEDIRAMESLIRDIIDQNVFCVYGNENIISRNKDLFGSLVRLD